MSIDIEQIQDAVLQVFADLDVPAGGQLSMDVLRREWPRLHMRRGDLVQGVRELIFAGHLELDEDMSGPLLILTPDGHRRLQARIELPKPVWSWFGMRKTPARKEAAAVAAEPAAAYGRRRSDESA